MQHACSTQGLTQALNTQLQPVLLLLLLLLLCAYLPAAGSSHWCHTLWSTSHGQ
jgi:hypothetical protein